MRARRHLGVALLALAACGSGSGEASGSGSGSASAGEAPADDPRAEEVTGDEAPDDESPEAAAPGASEEVAGGRPEAAGESAGGVAIVPGSARLVVVADHTLLGSEERAVEAARRLLARREGEATLVVPGEDEDEKRAASDFFEEGERRLPAAWADRAQVVLVRVKEPSSTRRGRQVSEGFDRVLVLHPPSLEPVWEESTSAGLGLGGARFGELLAELLERTARPEGEPE
ncbi:MAG TPA: hypothetical protein RMH85_27065 [Polyangiaceae bacterium LLY-WYZ-15_(1-7)]|nr:hypothetical protein [Myxococcales bacterium]MAT28147.1 hypothetical protein [Sandaracinus sp.]HJL00990.1 hypothetical protein [Polyangiaceae bacterium LLY-WYZ-15_(1-7)]MBJ73705.1 hypothetical protein [Sandaracinus sp.]HJL12168.1 hypothetical protein [Polyangiaceae bacterium LLY-WYZ-15_(1-7)]